MADNDIRAVALFMRDVWHAEFKRRRSRPTHDELVIAAYATSMALVNAEVGDAFKYLGAPRHVRSALQEFSGGAARFSRRLSDTALQVVEYLDRSGDNATARTAQSIELDRRVIALAARDYHRTGTVSDSDLGRALGVSHTSIRDRRLARSARIMARLHADVPDIWSANGRPVSEPNDSGKVLSSVAADASPESALAIAA